MPERVMVPGLDVPAPPPSMPMGMPSRGSVSSAADAEGAGGSGSDAASSDSAGAEIRGTIRLAEGVEAGSGVLFVIARGPSAGGPPLAVRKLDTARFPVEFSIGPSDVMMPGVRFAGPISLTARLDRDGNPMSRDPSDLAGSAEGALQPGATDVEIVLKRGDG